MSLLRRILPPAGRGLDDDRPELDPGHKVADPTAPDGELEQGSFFDHPLYLRTVRAERTDAASTKEALAAARLAGCKPGALILDAGCGNGRHALPLARVGYRVVAFDRSALLLAAGRRSAGGARWPRFVRGCYTSLPFGTGRFGAVLSLGTALGYLGAEGDQRALCEFRRVLVPGGRLVIETLHREELEARLAAYEERVLPSGATLRLHRRFDPARGILHEVQRLRDDAGWGPARAYNMRVYGVDELRSMLRRAAFGPTQWYGSLAGAGKPTPMTPLVVVARVPGRRRRREAALARLAPTVKSLRSGRFGRSSPRG
jgi:SAM-dependent methyltransferase